MKTIPCFLQWPEVYTFDQYRFPGLFKSFQSTSPGTVPVSKFHDIFFSFARVKLSSAAFENLQRNQFLICGYENNLPTVLYYSDDLISKITLPGYITNQEGFPVNEKFKNTLKTAGLTVAANTVELMIKKKWQKIQTKLPFHILEGHHPLLPLPHSKIHGLRSKLNLCMIISKILLLIIKREKSKLFIVRKMIPFPLEMGVANAGY